LWQIEVRDLQGERLSLGLHRRRGGDRFLHERGAFFRHRAIVLSMSIDTVSLGTEDKSMSDMITVRGCPPASQPIVTVGSFIQIAPNFAKSTITP
jgi:hypothetical protein